MSSGLGPNQTDLRTPLPENFYNPALRAAELLHVQMYQDGLTNLLNRDGVGLVLNELVMQKTPAFLAVIDIDDVKLINDTFGHPVGDLLFVEVAERLQSSLRTSPDEAATDIVARGRRALTSRDTERREHAGRIGGDEFIGIAPVPIRGDTHEIYRILHDRLANSLTFHSSEADRLSQINPPRTIHVSFGIALWDPNRGVPATDALKVADRKMYEAKAHFKAELHP